jgi:hypothetical protein
MGWASNYIDRLKRDETVRFRPRGNSMTPTIQSGQLVTVAPLLREESPSTGEVVLCRVHGREYLHFVRAVKSGGREFVIGNARGFVNGTISRSQIFGRLIKVEP